MQSIFDAIRSCNYHLLTIFLKSGYNFKIKSKPDENNILMVALLHIKDESKRFKMFHYLIGLNLVDLAETNKLNQDVYFIAVKTNCERELKYLLKHHYMSMDLQKRDREGKSLLHHAVICNNANILEELLLYCNKYRINVDIPDKVTKITPFLLAYRLNNHKATELLVRIGRANKTQMDPSRHLNADQWHQHGLLEEFQAYLKLKREEMAEHKLQGNTLFHSETKAYCESLKRAVERNIQILTPLVKVLTKHRQFDKRCDCTEESISDDIAEIAKCVKFPDALDNNPPTTPVYVDNDYYSSTIQTHHPPHPQSHHSPHHQSQHAHAPSLARGHPRATLPSQANAFLPRQIATRNNTTSSSNSSNPNTLSTNTNVSSIHMLRAHTKCIDAIFKRALEKLESDESEMRASQEKHANLRASDSTFSTYFYLLSMQGSQSYREKAVKLAPLSDKNEKKHGKHRRAARHSTLAIINQETFKQKQAAALAAAAASVNTAAANNFHEHHIQQQQPHHKSHPQTQSTELKSHVDGHSSSTTILPHINPVKTS